MLSISVKYILDLRHNSLDRVRKRLAKGRIGRQERNWLASPKVSFPATPEIESPGVPLASILDSEVLVAVATVAVAILTISLVLSNRQLAQAAISDQRARWRPVLIAANEEVDESVPGELMIQVRNVGRGPALGVSGELRISGPSGAVIPGQADICLVDDILALRFSCKGEYSRGLIRQFEVTYYDIGEWWQKTYLSAVPRKEPDGSISLHLARTFVSETDRQLGPVHGSPRARIEAEQTRHRPWRRAWRWVSGQTSRALKKIRRA